ncbi:hypothetical protein C8R45DRAFT_1113983 [Mycena sanguinolenta]|nr:hypothetical protein C8R45DRAFT_1113983 [Mycena sanguinolenta]
MAPGSQRPRSTTARHLINSFFDAGVIATDTLTCLSPHRCPRLLENAAATTAFDPHDCSGRMALPSQCALALRMPPLPKTPRTPLSASRHRAATNSMCDRGEQDSNCSLVKPLEAIRDRYAQCACRVTASARVVCTFPLSQNPAAVLKPGKAALVLRSWWSTKGFQEIPTTLPSVDALRARIWLPAARINPLHYASRKPQIFTCTPISPLFREHPHPRRIYVHSPECWTPDIWLIKGGQHGSKNAPRAPSLAPNLAHAALPCPVPAPAPILSSPPARRF